MSSESSVDSTEEYEFNCDLGLAEDAASQQDDIGFDPNLFVTAPDRFLLCAICTQVCENPSEATCGHLFCTAHISRWLTTNGTCPVDRKNVTLKPEIHLLYSDRLADLRMKCRYSTTGCENTLEVKDFRRHVASCSYSPRPCKWPGCTEKGLTGHNIDAHVLSCGFRPVRCELGCNRLIPIRSRLTHATQDCPNAEITCQHGCGMRMRRSGYSGHSGSVCPKAIVACSVDGCGQFVAREDLNQHLQTSIVSHFSLLCKSMNDLKSGLVASQRECRQLKRLCYGRMQPMVLLNHSDSTSTLAVSCDKSTLYSGSDDGEIRVWDISNRRSVLLMSTMRGATRLNAVWTLLVLDNYLFAGRKEGQTEVWDIRDLEAPPKRICSIAAHQHAVYALAATKTRLYTGSDDWSIHVWDISTLSTTSSIGFVCAVKGHKETVYALAIYKNMLFSSSWDCRIKVWDISTDAISCIQDLTQHTDSVGPLLVHEDRLYSGSWDCTIKVWQLSEDGGAEPVRLIADLHSHTANVYTLSASNGTLFSGSMDADIIAWDISGSGPDIVSLAKLSAHTDSVDAVVVVDDRLFSGSQDKTVRVWF